MVSNEWAPRRAVLDRREHYAVQRFERHRMDGWERVRSVGHYILTAARERYDRVASAAAIEPRDPFMDLRVIRFCLSLPWEQLQSGGWPKIILRRAMAGVLPSSVLWKKGRDHLGPDFTREILRGLDAARIADSVSYRETMSAYIDLDSQEPVTNASAADCKEWVDKLCLFLWLESARRGRGGVLNSEVTAHE
jgi:asparagine synthase (glutamine-hydrolysing)